MSWEEPTSAEIEALERQAADERALRARIAKKAEAESAATTDEVRGSFTLQDKAIAVAPANKMIARPQKAK